MRADVLCSVTESFPPPPLGGAFVELRAGAFTRRSGPFHCARVSQIGRGVLKMRGNEIIERSQDEMPLRLVHAVSERLGAVLL